MSQKVQKVQKADLQLNRKYVSFKVILRQFCVLSLYSFYEGGFQKSKFPHFHFYPKLRGINFQFFPTQKVPNSWERGGGSKKITDFFHFLSSANIFSTKLSHPFLYYVCMSLCFLVFFSRRVIGRYTGF